MSPQQLDEKNHYDYNCEFEKEIKGIEIGVVIFKIYHLIDNSMTYLSDLIKIIVVLINYL